jgi:hypothetical protein
MQIYVLPKQGVGFKGLRDVHVLLIVFLTPPASNVCADDVSGEELYPPLHTWRITSKDTCW